MQKYCLDEIEGLYYHCEFLFYELELALLLSGYSTVHKNNIKQNMHKLYIYKGYFPTLNRSVLLKCITLSSSYQKRTQFDSWMTYEH